jgi:hypothetical protein
MLNQININLQHFQIQLMIVTCQCSHLWVIPDKVKAIASWKFDLNNTEKCHLETFVCEKSLRNCYYKDKFQGFLMLVDSNFTVFDGFRLLNDKKSQFFHLSRPKMQSPFCLHPQVEIATIFLYQYRNPHEGLPILTKLRY